MNLKKLFSTVLIVICISLSMPAVSNAMPTETGNTAPVKTDVTVDPMVRLQEIRDMDRSNLSRIEKKELRQEVKEIKRSAKSKNGVYLSVGAIVIIVLLLILLL